MSTAAHRKRGADATSAELLRDDRIILTILLAHLPLIMFLAPIGYGTESFAIASSALVGGLTLAGYLTLRGTPWFGRLAAVVLVTLSTILIQTQLGRIEMHFHIFLALTILLIYRNWLVIALAAAVVTLHQLALTALQLHGVGLGEMPLMTFSYSCSWGAAILHTAFIAAEALVLVYCARLTSADRRTAEQLGTALATLEQDKNLTLRIRDSGDNPSVATFNSLIGDLASLTQDIAQCARDVRAVAVQLETSAQDAVRDGSLRHEQTTQAAAAVQTMTQTVHEAAETARSGSDLTASANEQAQDGHDLFARAMRATADLQRTMTDATSAIRRLESDAECIDRLVATVRGIAERAVRLAHAHSGAGEDTSAPDPLALTEEVRTLALAAQESAQALQEVVSRLRSNLEGAVARADQGRRQTSETSSDILQAGLALNQVLESVARITDMNARVAAALELQRRVTDGINATMLAITDQGRQLVDQAQADLGLAARLQQVSRSLDACIAAYRH